MAHFLALVLVDRSGPHPVRRARALMLSHFAPDLGDEPSARCDGFVVGGRYDGDLWGKEQQFHLTPAQHEARYGLDVVEEKDNVRPVAELREGLVPHAIVTDDGRWHDGEGKSAEEWPAEVESILRTYPDHLAVAMDCHC